MANLGPVMGGDEAFTQGSADAAPSAPSATDLTPLIDAFYLAANDTAHSTVTLIHTRLSTIQSTLTSHPSLLPSFLALHYPSLSLHLLTRFAIDWLPSLTSPQRHSIFDFFFSPPSIPPSYTLLALSSALRSPYPTHSTSPTPSPSTLHPTITPLLSPHHRPPLSLPLQRTQLSPSPHSHSHPYPLPLPSPIPPRSALH